MDELARLTIRVDDRDAPRVVRNLDEVTKATRRAEDGAAKMASSVKNMLGGLAAALSVRELVNYSDAATNLANRLRLVTSSEAERVRTSRELFEVSRRTRSDVTATAELYVKLRQSNENLNYTTQQTRDLTESFALALKASGADASASAGAIRQFAQAMASGAVRGDEFVTISEAAPVVLQLMQKELGKSSVELRKMKEEGQLTASLIGGVLLKNLDALRTQAAGNVMSVADGFVQLRNSIIKTIGASNDMATAANNIAQGLANAGRLLEENGPVIGQVIKFTALAYGATKAIQAMTAAVVALNGASLASLAARLGPLVAVLAPFAGFAAKGMRDASDAQDRAADVARLSGLSATELGTLSAGNERSRAAIIGRRKQIAGLSGADRSEAQAEDVALNRRYQELTEEYRRLREAAAGLVTAAGGGAAGSSGAPVSVKNAADAAKRALDAQIEEWEGLTEMTRNRYARLGVASTAFVAAQFGRDAGAGPGDKSVGMLDPMGQVKGPGIEQAAQRASQVTQALADGLQRSIAQGIAGGFTDGSKSLAAFADNLKRTIVNVLSEAAANRIVGGLLGSGGGGGGGSAVGGLLGGLLGKKGGAVAAGGGIGLAAAGLGLFAGSQILNLFKTEKAGYGTFAPGQSITPQAEVIRAGTYNAPSGFNAGAYRFDAGRPSGAAVTGNTIVVTLPEGTPRQQAEAMLAEFERLARAQGLPAGTLPLSNAA